MILDRAFFDRNTVEVAQELLGKKLVRVIGDSKIVALITETEAYRSDDPACHAHRGKTERNAALFGPTGHTYVYFTYGMHFCVNIVAREHGCPAGGILLRALMPIEGIDIIKTFRPKHTGPLLNGPAIITQALNIDRSHGGCDVTDSNSIITVEEGISIDPAAILATPRIGISQAQEKPWRFLISPHHLDSQHFIS